MSLINDALKKAQRERSGQPETPAVSASPAAPRPAAGPAPGGSRWLPGLLALAVVGTGLAVWFLKPAAGPARSASPVAATAPAAPLPVAATPPVALYPSINDIAAPAPPPAPAVSAPPAAPVASTPPAGPEAPAIRLNLAPAPPTAAPPPAEPPPAPAVPVASGTGGPTGITLHLQDPRIIAFLESARINGIRPTAEDPRLLLNNKVLRPGSVVDRDLGLRLVSIEPGKLTFVDAQGTIYTREP